MRGQIRLVAVLPHQRQPDGEEEDRPQRPMDVETRGPGREQGQRPRNEGGGQPPPPRGKRVGARY